MTGRAPTVDHLNIAALSALPDDAPVVMLNLMRFRDRSLDGKVRYPSRTAFIDMMTSPEYAQANVERENGCVAHTIIALRETYNKLAPTKE